MSSPDKADYEFALEENAESFRKIQELVQKTSEMREQVKQQDEYMEQKFNELRLKINNSSAFLQSTKSQIENLKFLYQHDPSDMNSSVGDCLADPTQNLEEIQRQMDEVKMKLDYVKQQALEAQERRSQLFENDNFETTTAKTMETFSNIAEGKLGELNSEDTQC